MKPGEKAFMWSKSTGATWRELSNRKHMYSDVYETTNIVYNGRKYNNVVVAYFVRSECQYDVFTYEQGRQIGGDHYLKNDYITLKDLQQSETDEILPKELFEI